MISKRTVCKKLSSWFFVPYLWQFVKSRTSVRAPCALHATTLYRVNSSAQFVRQRTIASELDRTPAEIVKKLEDAVRNFIALSYRANFSSSRPGTLRCWKVGNTAILIPRPKNAAHFLRFVLRFSGNLSAAKLAISIISRFATWKRSDISRSRLLGEAKYFTYCLSDIKGKTRGGKPTRTPCHSKEFLLQNCLSKLVCLPYEDSVMGEADDPKNQVNQWASPSKLCILQKIREGMFHCWPVTQGNLVSREKCTPWKRCHWSNWRFYLETVHLMVPRHLCWLTFDMYKGNTILTEMMADEFNL